jgi:folate-binding protein YgfZ
MNAFFVPIERDVITVTGTDAKTYLHSQVSQDVNSLEIGDSRYAFLLQPTGKIDVVLRITCATHDRYVLDMEPGFGEAALARLNRFKIRVRADMELSGQVWRAIRTSEPVRIEGALRAWSGDGRAWDVFAPNVGLGESIPPGTLDDYDAFRLECGWPLMGQDISTDMVPAETGIVEHAVSFTKGCYPGQELVERMDSRKATPPRQLRVIERSPEMVVGSEVVRDGAVVGVVTSVGGHRAFALVKRGA